MKSKVCMPLLFLVFLSACSISNADWKYVSPMPYARFGHDATLGSDNKIYVMGGFVFYRHDGLFSNVVYDREKDTWEILEPVPGYLHPGKYMMLENGTGIWRRVRKVTSQEDKYEIFAPVEGKYKWTLLPGSIPVEKLRKTGVQRLKKNGTGR